MDADLIALLERVKNGNDKLWAAWRVDFLNLLCKELVVKGYTDCLYIENGLKTKSCVTNKDEPEWFCNTCPAAIGQSMRSGS